MGTTLKADLSGINYLRVGESHDDGCTWRSGGHSPQHNDLHRDSRPGLSSPSQWQWTEMIVLVLLAGHG
jgi:hypothetical protein